MGRHLYWGFWEISGYVEYLEYVDIISENVRKHTYLCVVVDWQYHHHHWQEMYKYVVVQVRSSQVTRIRSPEGWSLPLARDLASNLPRAFFFFFHRLRRVRSCASQSPAILPRNPRALTETD